MNKIVALACLLSLFALTFANNFFLPDENPFEVIEDESSLKYNNPAYSASFAKTMVYAAGLGYCSITSIKSWKCGTPCTSLSGFSPYYEFQSSSDPALAFAILVNDAAKEVVFTFRGTNNPVQLVNEITSGQGAPYSTAYWSAANAQVLSYFQDKYKSTFQSLVISNLGTLGTSSRKDYKYIFTGHSLGGALATLAALDASTSKKIPVTSGSSPYLITYGSPRVGNYYFAMSVNTIIPVMFRVTHYNDIVPHVPPCAGSTPVTACKAPTSFEELEKSQVGGYWYGWQVKQEIWYNDPSTSYTVCSQTNSEDPLCSDSLYVDTVDAHYYYLGLPISNMCS